MTTARASNTASDPLGNRLGGGVGGAGGAGCHGALR